MANTLLDDCDAMIFDFDGVIVESADIKTSAFRTMYERHGREMAEVAVMHHVANGGISRRKKIRHLHRTYLNHELSEDDLDHLCRQFALVVEDAVVAAAAVAGAHDLLAANSGRRQQFVVSGTPHDELLRIVGRRGLARFFEEVFGSPPEKPPIIRDILFRHRLAEERVVFVGDSSTDYDAARETGVRFVGRVPPGAANPFPADAPIIPDLTALVP